MTDHDMTPGVRADADEKGDLRMKLVLILVSVLLAAVAQLVLKSGVNHVTGDSNGLQLNGASLKELLSSGTVWLGLVLFGLSAIFWLFALSRASLSYAYPFAALGYVVIVANSVFVLHEQVPPMRWLGVGLIVAGILFVAFSSTTGA